MILEEKMCGWNRRLAISNLTNKGTQKKHEILDAASRLIKIHGYEGMTLRMLADEAGISRGHLGHYFKEKKEILFSLLDATVTYVCKNSKALCKEDRDPFTTYAFSVSWFCIVCAELKDVGKNMFQSIRYFDIQRSFSRLFAERIWEYIGEDMTGCPYDLFEKRVEMAFAAEFTGIADYTIEDFGQNEAKKFSEINIRVLLMLMDVGSERTEFVIRRTKEHLEKATPDIMFNDFNKSYKLFALDADSSNP